MRSPEVVDKIRKLLRLSRLSPGEESNEARQLEAQLALDRARALMEKHGISVDEDEDRRQVVGGAGQTLWGRFLLSAAAGAFDCRALHNVRRGESMLRGFDRDVDRAWRAYDRLRLDALSASEESWRWFLESEKQDSDSFNFDWSNDSSSESSCSELWERPECADVWQRVYLIALGERALQRVEERRGRRKPPPAFESPPPGAPQPAARAGDEDEATKAEIEQLGGEVRLLAALIGERPAARLGQWARRTGFKRGETVAEAVWDEARVRGLLPPHEPEALPARSAAWSDILGEERVLSPSMLWMQRW